MFPIRFFIFLILLCSIHGAPPVSRYQNNPLVQPLHPKPKDYDNRYVWFTRNIPDDYYSADDDYELDLEESYQKKSSVKIQNFYPT